MKLNFRLFLINIQAGQAHFDSDPQMNYNLKGHDLQHLTDRSYGAYIFFNLLSYKQVAPTELF
jgi:hypothetical protein